MCVSEEQQEGQWGEQKGWFTRFELLPGEVLKGAWESRRCARERGQWVDGMIGADDEVVGKEKKSKLRGKELKAGRGE